MAKLSTFKEDLSRFSRLIVMMFNRVTMYQMGHPSVAQSITDFYPALQQLFKSVSPLLFILHLDQFFIDDEPIDARVNVQRVLTFFKKAKVQSISFENGLSMNELMSFLEIFTSQDEYPDADAIKRGMVAKGVRNMKINHVLFKKVSQDDEIISHDTLKNLTPEFSDEESGRSKKFFVDLVLEKLLADELSETLTVENLIKDPAALSQKMTKTELESRDVLESAERPAGAVLLHQLEILGGQVEENMRSGEESNLQEVVSALFEMKKRLLENIEAQRAQNEIFENEEIILDKANQITDVVLLRIVKDEYNGGKTSLERLAQILRRLVPDPMELKRLLPGIRVALMEEGMQLDQYLILVQELTKKFQGDELAQILEESSEEIGIEGKTLIEEVKNNPVQAAELIFLASEIRKGAGDERVLTDLLVDYVERLGSDKAKDLPENDHAEAEQHLRQVITSIESRLVGRLKKMDVKDDLLERLEDRFSKRIDDILHKVKLDWLQSHAPQDSSAIRKERSALELLEQSVSQDDILVETLAVVRTKVEAGEIDENDFGQIYALINKEQQARTQEAERLMPTGVLRASTLALIIEKEIARSKRHGTSFSTLAFSMIKAVQKKSAGSAGKISYSACMAALLKVIVISMRDDDIVGELGKNRIALLLPMASKEQAQHALRRCLKLLHTRPIKVNGILLNFRVAGVSATFEASHRYNAAAFIQLLTDELNQMERRQKNLQAYF